jgi:hypothetical protein
MPVARTINSAPDDLSTPTMAFTKVSCLLSLDNSTGKQLRLSLMKLQARIVDKLAGNRCRQLFIGRMVRVDQHVMLFWNDD